MNIIAIESSSSICGAALFIDDKLVEIDEINKPFIHGTKLPAIINKLVNNNFCEIRKLDAIAVSSGPGSYTGLRIGMNLSRGLAASLNIPIIPVPTLFSMNNNIDTKGSYWVAIHSHKNMIYIQNFNSGEPNSEVMFEEYKHNKYEILYGFNLGNFCKEYNLVVPSAKYIGELALKNYNKWMQKDLNKVFPSYITNFNLGNKKI